MLIDRKARPWFFGCFVILAVATYFFIQNWRDTHGQPTGGSWHGLVFGAIGSAAMLVAMLLALRKKTRWIWLGRPYAWMQAHIWFGLLSYPLILYHAGGFSWGGCLTQALMWIFTVVYITGIIGLILQKVIPARLLRETPAETIAAQIPHVLHEFRQEAEALMQPFQAGREREALSAGSTGRGTAVMTPPRAASELDAFDRFYSSNIVPFLGDKYQRESSLAAAPRAQEMFSQWRARLPEPLHSAVSRLESLVDERRQLDRQKRLNAWLHRWLLIHVPLSYALITLGIIHGVMAFLYTSPGR